VVPLINSLIYAFSDIRFEPGNTVITFTGLKNIKYVLFEDPYFFKNVGKGFSTFAYSFPLIIVVSLVMALILVQNFKGRIFFRGISFMTVIIASGVVIEFVLRYQGADITSAGTEASIMEDMINVESILTVLGLPSQISQYFQVVLESIMTVIWNSGIQTLLFISGLQAIPDQLYEVSKVEGATKWEEFWFVTFPMLSKILVLVSAFTVVELFTSKTDRVVSSAYTMMQSTNYHESTAMLWIYFLIVGIVVSLIYIPFNKYYLKRWE
jgi:ABC-type sugar transport system permease subunit